MLGSGMFWVVSDELNALHRGLDRMVNKIFNLFRCGDVVISRGDLRSVLRKPVLPAESRLLFYAPLSHTESSCLRAHDCPFLVAPSKGVRLRIVRSVSSIPAAPLVNLPIDYEL